MGIERERGTTVAGKYVIEARIGVGGMSEVYRARNELLDRAVAIKFLLPELATDARAVRRFMKEGQLASKVRHPNVVDILDVDKDPTGVPFMVQDYLRGEDLDAHVLVKGGRLTADEALEILTPIAEALGYAHGCGVVHRDVKPANIFLSLEHGRCIPKLVDFGIAHIHTKNATATATAVDTGTPAYMSPEQIYSPADVGPPTDVWAFGVVLYEVLTGLIPFTGSTFADMFVQIAKAAHHPVRHYAKDAPASIEAVIERCLRKNKADRYPTASELAADLNRARSAKDEARIASVSKHTPKPAVDSGRQEAESPPAAAASAPGLSPALEGDAVKPPAQPKQLSVPELKRPLRGQTVDVPDLAPREIRSDRARSPPPMPAAEALDQPFDEALIERTSRAPATPAPGSAKQTFYKPPIAAETHAPAAPPAPPPASAGKAERGADMDDLSAEDDQPLDIDVAPRSAREKPTVVTKGMGPISAQKVSVPQAPPQSGRDVSELSLGAARASAPSGGKRAAGPAPVPTSTTVLPTPKEWGLFAGAFAGAIVFLFAVVHQPLHKAWVASTSGHSIVASGVAALMLFVIAAGLGWTASQGGVSKSVWVSAGGCLAGTILLVIVAFSIDEAAKEPPDVAHVLPYCMPLVPLGVAWEIFERARDEWVERRKVSTGMVLSALMGLCVFLFFEWSPLAAALAYVSK